MRIRNIRTLALTVIASLACLPAVALAAEEEASKWGPLLTIGRFFNLAIVIGVLVWATRKPLAAFFVSRSESIRDQLAQAQKVKAEAEAKLAEMNARMSHLDDELREIKATAEREAKEEYDRLLTTAQQDAEKIVDRARQEIDGMMRTAQSELKGYVAELSVQMAEDKIRGEITSDDQARLFTHVVSNLRGKL